MKIRYDIDDISIGSMVKGDTISKFSAELDRHETIDEGIVVIKTTDGKKVIVCFEGVIDDCYITIEKK